MSAAYLAHVAPRKDAADLDPKDEAEARKPEHSVAKNPPVLTWGSRPCPAIHAYKVSRSLWPERPLHPLLPSTPSDTQHTSFDRISDRKDEHIIPNIKPQSDLHLLDLQGCIVDLRAKEGGKSIQALQLRDLQQCVIFAGRIDGSVMIHDCQDCLFILECRQFRMHSSQNIFVFISTKSIATIEHCTKIAFGPASNSLLEGKDVVEDATYDIPKVQDFDHISTLTPSPNWHTVGKEDFLAITQKLKGEHKNAKEILSALFL